MAVWPDQAFRTEAEAQAAVGESCPQVAVPVPGGAALSHATPATTLNYGIVPFTPLAVPFLGDFTPEEPLDPFNRQRSDVLPGSPQSPRPFR